MSSQRDDDDDSRGVVWAVLIGVMLLAVSLAIGMGLYVTNKARAAAGGAGVAPAVSAAGAASDVSANGGAVVIDENNATVLVQDGVVKFYFASGKAEIAPGAAQALGDVVRGVAAGKTAVISGFHDQTGSAALNEELSKQRALAVRAALLELGVLEGQVDLRKPEVMQASGSNAEARRVEVHLE